LGRENLRFSDRDKTISAHSMVNAKKTRMGGGRVEGNHNAERGKDKGLLFHQMVILRGFIKWENEEHLQARRRVEKEVCLPVWG